MNVYYNEHDRFAAAWLRELIREGAIPVGDVDERDIQLVQPADLAGYGQCHFFAGIGGWAYALELACWSGPVWTGSCPCQPFSSAGKRQGFEDTRHLWPSWFRLIRECRPAVVFGEQVASPDGLHWFDAVSADLEAASYAVGAADLPAAGVGAPHLRQRLFFVAESQRGAAERQRQQLAGSPGEPARAEEERQRLRADSGHGGGLGGVLAHTKRRRRESRSEPTVLGRVQESNENCGVGQADAHGAGQRPSSGGVRNERDDPWRSGEVGSVGNPGHASRRPHAGGRHDLEGRDGLRPGRPEASGEPREHGAWSDLVWLPCSDGKARPTQPGIFPLVDGVPNRVGALRGAGNAISPQVAAQFIRAYRAVSEPSSDGLAR